VAEIVVGIAASHTPQLSSGADMWSDHALRDSRNPELLGTDGEFHTYDELLARADPAIQKELTQEIWDEKYRRGQEALRVLTDRLAKARVDVALVIGDDQAEIFGEEGNPSFGFFLGDELIDQRPGAEEFEQLPEGIRAAFWAAHGEQPSTHRMCASLSRHVVEALVEADFDPLVFCRQPAGTTLGHAFTFPRYRLALPIETPITPVFINTYFPPNVPSAERCYRLGKAIAGAVSSWPDDARVAVIASGGLSHFVVDEELDWRVLNALVAADPGPLCSIPRKLLRSGTSEILNWVAAAGALEHLTANVIDYLPSYRSPAGTGAGMAFAFWQ